MLIRLTSMEQEIRLKFRKRLLTIILIILVTIIIGLCGWFLSILIPIYIFDRAYSAAIPKYDALNNAVFAEIPFPHGAREIERFQSANPNNYGRYLYVDYVIENNSPDEIVQYYRDLFLSKGWKDYTINPSSNMFLFSDKRSCADIHIYGDNRLKYTLSIYADIWNQDFSPSKSNLDFNSLNFGYANLITCP